jgi:hypothetical protein
MKAETDRKGVRFHITREMIREYHKLPLEERLRSLQEQIVLSYRLLTPERRRIWEKFRSGEL